MARPIHGHRVPHGTFWVKDPLHAKPGVWAASFAGERWELVKRTDPSLGRPGWYLAGTDPDGTVTAALWLGQSQARAKQLGQRWITRPWTRQQIRAETG